MIFSCISNLHWMAILGFILEVGATANQGFCVDHGYTPKKGHRTPIAHTGYEFFPGSVIRYSCDKYFQLVPAINMQECKKNGSAGYKWIPELPPKCVETIQCPKPVISHGTCDKQAYHKGDVLIITCNNGYTLTQEREPVCLETGQWSNLPTCKESNCPLPPPLENGFYSPVKNPYSFNGIELPPKTQLLYGCNDGYQLEPISQQIRECREGHWTGVDPLCVQEGCDPPELSTGDYIPKRPHYEVQDTVTYLCHSEHDVTRSCQPDHTWSGSSCPGALTTVQMPYSPSQEYCTRPVSSDGHLNIKCCEPDQDVSDDSYCCHVRGLVQFTCDVDFAINGQQTQWMCSSSGWVALSSNSIQKFINPPSCVRNETRGNGGEFSDDLLKPVLGTAAGVLLILSVAIIIAFCRPKLIDMKRRWRELREDEDELIIDGRRILLPSYEEAVTSRELCQQQEASSSQTPTNCDHDTSTPSLSQLRTCIRNTSSSSNSTSREEARPSCSSDEEMLVPEPVSNHQLQSVGENVSRPQSLTLRAGTSVDACVVINPPPNEQTKTDTDRQEDSASMPFPSSTNVIVGSYSDVMAEDDPILNLDTDVDLESISPQVPPSETQQMRPVVLNDSSYLLSYPLSHEADQPSKQQYMIHINTNGTSSNSNDFSTSQDNQCCVDISVEDTEPESKEYQEQDKGSGVLQSPDQISIVMSSQTAENCSSSEEMGSTAV